MKSARAPRAPFSIAQVSERTGIPVTTLRFYEKELPSLFRIRKTRGGHRRYDEEDVHRFAAVRKMTEAEGIRLAEVRRLLRGRAEEEALRRDVDLLLEVKEAETREMSEMHRRLEELERRVAAVERHRQAGQKGKRKWFG